MCFDLITASQKWRYLRREVDWEYCPTAARKALELADFFWLSWALALSWLAGIASEFSQDILLALYVTRNPGDY